LPSNLEAQMTVTEDTLAGNDSAPSPVPAVPTRPVKVAIYGLGRIGLQHAAILSTIPHVELTGIGDASRDARRNARGMGLAARAFATDEILLRRAEPQAMFLADSHELAPGMARRALEAGAAVLLEGVPLLPLSEVEGLLAAAQRAGRPVCAALPLAHHPVFAAASLAVANGVLGAMREVRASRTVSRVFHPAQQRSHAAGGATRGALAHVGTELVFVLTRMFGRPRLATATITSMYGALEDDARATWQLASNARVGIEVSWSTPGYPRPATVIEVEAENGRLLVSEDALEVELLEARAGFDRGHTRLGRREIPHLARFELDGDARWIEDAAFLAWAEGGAEPPTGLAAMRDAAATLDALYASARSGSKPVEVAA
jgi:predicted dehydrogenase